MSNAVGIVEVAASTHSSPDRQVGFANRLFGGKPLLEWVVRRVTESLLLDQVVVVADAAHGESVRRYLPPDIDFFVGDEPDAMSKLAAVLRQTDATQLVRIAVDQPFVDPQLIDRLIATANTHPGCDYIGYASSRGQPALHAQLGMFGEWCRADAVFAADRSAADAADRAQPLRYICGRPEVFQLRLIPVPQELDRDDIRLTIAGEDDWEHAQIIYDALGPEDLDWQRIANLLAVQPDLRRMMATLNQTSG